MRVRGGLTRHSVTLLKEIQLTLSDRLDLANLLLPNVCSSSYSISQTSVEDVNKTKYLFCYLQLLLAKNKQLINQLTSSHHHHHHLLLLLLLFIIYLFKFKKKKRKNKQLSITI
ncbi:hypothetical protein T4D_8191 [Trichinella pseudospiralis]|uniref:Uncharacterized protein n=1 Tax=Trichinella pseudospiralis TaxID=6337 RepID=A0A0V1FVE4_TRIPS|nr:hypothetical protein T4D_8191 [Trichinella pseudospiralis]